MIYLIGKYLPDQKLVRIGLNLIYGLGPSKAKKLCDKLNIHENLRFKNLTDPQKNALARELSYLKLESRLKKEIRDNIERLKSFRCYRGVRHLNGLPVRGQRTHTNAKTQKYLSRKKNNFKGHTNILSLKKNKTNKKVKKK